MAEKLWWKKQLRIVQYNLQMRDTMLMDPGRIASQTAEMGFNAVVINVLDSVVWYRTLHNVYQVNPYLPEERDLMKELIEAFHAENIKVIARAMSMGMEEDTYYKRPQWVARKPDNSPVIIGDERPGGWKRFYALCHNREETPALDIAVEAFSRYDFDGAFWISGMEKDNCWCSHCKKLYKEKYGKEMPLNPQELEKGWLRSVQRKHDKSIMEALLKIKPDIPVLHYYFPFDVEDAGRVLIPAISIEGLEEVCNALNTEAQDKLSNGVDKLPIWCEPTVAVKLGRSLEGFPPPFTLIHTCPGMDWRHCSIQEAEYMYWAGQVAANGGSFWASMTGFPDTIPDKRIFRTLKTINAGILKTEELMDGAESNCDILLVNSGSSSIKGWADGLLCSHLDFDIANAYQLTEKRIKKYKLVILPENFVIDDITSGVIKKYVENGGNIIVEGTDENKLAPVRTLLGVNGSVVSSEDLECTYIRVEKEAEILSGLMEDTPLIPLKGKIGYSSLKDGAKVLATWVPSFAKASFAGMPPERASLPKPSTDIPLCSVIDHGKGKVMFVAYQAGRMINRYALKDMYSAVESYVLYMIGTPEITAEAPGRVMISSFIKGNELYIHLVNGVGSRPLLENIPIHDIRICIQIKGKKAAGVKSVIEENTVKYKNDGDRILIDLKKLQSWDMIRVKLKNAEIY